MDLIAEAADLAVARSGAAPRNPGKGDAPRKVCHLGKFYPPASGGIETHLQAAARAQAEAGLGVRVLCVNHRGPGDADVTWRTLARTGSVREADGPVEIERLGRWASVVRLEVCPKLVGRLRSLQGEGFDLLHLHVPNPTMLVGLFLARPRLPWVITYHSDVVKQRMLLAVQRPVENWVFRRARAIFATSAEYVAGSEYLQRFRDKVRIVPLGIDLEPYLQPSAEALAHEARLRQTYGDPLWLAVGRLVYYKGFATALAALPRVAGKLLLVGVGPLRADLERQARELGVADRVVWLPHLSPAELVGAYHAATAFWFPSNARSEAFGLVQVEAMASGCPVINTAIAGSGVPWVSRDGESGRTVPVDDPAAFAAAANELARDPDLRARLGRQGRERAVAEFSAARMAERTLAGYREVLARKSDGR
jgi:glycosyltransferase involved in cell wall biosynthesis